MTTRNSMHKKIVFAAVLSACFFIAFLGMRKPILDQDTRLKDRHRAVVENVVTNPLESFDDHKVEVEFCQKVIVAVFAQFHPVAAHDVYTFHSISSPTLNSRAPPPILTMNA